MQNDLEFGQLLKGRTRRRRRRRRKRRKRESKFSLL